MLARFTSSEIERLTGAKGKFNTYLDEKKAETNVGRRDMSGGSKATNWGNLCEEWLLVNHLDLSYVPCHKNSIKHETIKCFSGTPDYIRDGVSVGDIKSPQLKNFGLLAECETGEDLKKVAPKYYWQLISNFILGSQDNNLETCELMVFSPTQAQAIEILKYNSDKQNKQLEDWQCPYYSYMDYIEDIYAELPILGNDALVKSTHLIEFEPPQDDIDLLIEKVTLASSMLEAWYNKKIAK